MHKVDSYAKSFIGVATNDGTPEPEFNKNVEWMKEPSAWVFYPLALATAVVIMNVVTPWSLATCLGIVHLLHGIVTFALLHWVKGSPDFYDQGNFNGLTFWEQVDAGEPWTATKKYLMLVPTVLLLATLLASNYSRQYLIIHVPVWVALMIGKLPQMQGVRILGINSTPGIDDERKKK